MNTGAQSELPGQSKIMDWWQVEEPGLNTVCLIFLDYVTLDGDIDLLPVFTPDAIPTPLTTMTEIQKGIQVILVSLGSNGPYC